MFSKLMLEILNLRRYWDGIAGSFILFKKTRNTREGSELREIVISSALVMWILGPL